jgi:hypothetical protein
MPGIEALLNRGGAVSGAVGIDDKITSAEALEDLMAISSTSTVVHSDTGPIVHPKWFLFEGANHGLVVVGSANLTRDGLYRNVEYGIELAFDLADVGDGTEFGKFRTDMDSLLNASAHSQRLDVALLANIEADGKVERETQTSDPDGAPKRLRRPSVGTRSSFAPMILPPPPPGIQRRSAVAIARGLAHLGAATGSVFVMELSAFDSSHRTGTVGTPEILIPNDAMAFFPKPGPHGKKYDDARMLAILNHPEGPELHDYRLWVYPGRDENRLRMNHRTIDLTTQGGGDLLVISKVASPEAGYEVTLVPPTGSSYAYYRALCTNASNDKRWGTT